MLYLDPPPSVPTPVRQKCLASMGGGEVSNPCCNSVLARDVNLVYLDICSTGLTSSY